MLITGRTRQEYHAMFDLRGQDLCGAVLDCCAGASSFTAEARGAGVEVTAVDPCYRMAPDQLADTLAADRAGTGRLVDATPEAFEWTWYRSREHHEQLRKAAISQFLLDRMLHPDRYVPGALPVLPFEDRRFDLVLCSHLLFTWATGLGEHWHRQALAELVRVSDRQVRVFPLVGKGTEGPPPFLRPLVQELRAQGLDVRAHPVPMRFQRGARHAMVITRVPRPPEDARV